MHRQRVDYSGFRLSRVKEPQFRHVLLFGTWIIYFILFLLTENLIPPERCHIMHCAVDDMIPFNEYFLIFYTGWYLLVAGSLAYYFLYDVQRFKELDLYIFVTQVVAMAIYILFPSRQDLRPAVFPRENFFTWVMGLIYTLDTDTGVCPSLHVAYSLAIFNVIVKDKDVHKWVKWFVGILPPACALPPCLSSSTPSWIFWRRCRWCCWASASSTEKLLAAKVQQAKGILKNSHFPAL